VGAVNGGRCLLFAIRALSFGSSANDEREARVAMRAVRITPEMPEEDDTSGKTC